MKYFYKKIFLFIRETTMPTGMISEFLWPPFLISKSMEFLLSVTTFVASVQTPLRNYVLDGCKLDPFTLSPEITTQSAKDPKSPMPSAYPPLCSRLLWLVWSWDTRFSDTITPCLWKPEEKVRIIANNYPFSLITKLKFIFYSPIGSIFRPLFFEFPEDENLFDLDNQFILGKIINFMKIFIYNLFKILFIHKKVLSLWELLL